jgi:hypothetical protein
MSRELYAEMLGYLGLPAGIAIAASLSGDELRACRKLWRRPQNGPWRPSLLDFVNLRKTEAEREQPVLLAHRPGARKAEPLAQP